MKAEIASKVKSLKKAYNNPALTRSEKLDIKVYIDKFEKML